MIFVDEARIFLKAGDGGKGCESFRSEKLSRYPKPDGGDGAKGGDIIFIADSHIQTLLDFRFKQHYKAKHGGHGKGKGKTGRTGEDCTLRVPLGTIIRDNTTNLVIKDLVHEGENVIVAKGGQGGKGNANHKTPTSPTPGEQKEIRLELKLIAHVGLIGFPNAGKSTIISAISRVKSKVASYPFTTKQPILGIVPGEDFDFIVADLPGLIEGAHQGRGLGDKFLRHVERTKILVHVLDLGASEGRDPLDDYELLNHELESYGGHILFKKRIVVGNKIDLPEAEKNLKRFRKKHDVRIIPISATEKTGLNKVVESIREVLCQENSPVP